MNPRLLGSRAPSGSHRGPATRRSVAACGALVITLASLVVTQARLDASQASLGARPSQAAVHQRAPAISPPPTSFGLGPVPGSPRGGSSYVLKTSKSLPVARSTALFEFYLRSMVATGWSLQAQGRPDAKGQWSLSWTQGKRIALISLYTSPKVSLTVDSCPPEPYC